MLGPLGRALAESLRQGKPRPQDAGVVELAKRYAALIDEATPKSIYAQHLRQIEAALDPDNDAAQSALQKVRDALAAHSVASDLGPKLLAVLSSLGLAGQGAKGGTAGVSIAAKLDEFSARRARKHVT